MWGKRGEGLAKILAKGTTILVEGALRTQSYEKDGQRHYSTEVHASQVLLGGRSGGAQEHMSYAARSDPDLGGADAEEDIPF